MVWFGYLKHCPLLFGNVLCIRTELRTRGEAPPTCLHLLLNLLGVRWRLCGRALGGGGASGGARSLSELLPDMAGTCVRL
jgi:hypothetical protein